MTWSDFRFNKITAAALDTDCRGMGGSGETGKEARAVIQVTLGTDWGPSAVRCACWAAFMTQMNVRWSPSKGSASLLTPHFSEASESRQNTNSLGLHPHTSPRSSVPSGVCNLLSCGGLVAQRELRAREAPWVLVCPGQESFPHPLPPQHLRGLLTSRRTWHVAGASSRLPGAVSGSLPCSGGAPALPGRPYSSWYR